MSAGHQQAAAIAREDPFTDLPLSAKGITGGKSVLPSKRRFIPARDFPSCAGIR